jgi:diguanylate cyclase (GGDEF)-like protein
MKDDLNKQINYDNLTGLPNRTLYMDLLKEYIKHAKRSKSKAAVILIDLDHFKIINDSFGHQEGDRLIQTFSELIQSTIRDEDTTARFGGDSFAILLEDIEDDLAPVRILEELKQVLEESSIIINDQQVNITFSAGISIYPQDGDTPENLFKNSDAALYEAKEMGRDTYKYYTNELTQKAFERVVMDSSLRDAVKNEDFVLYYQPQYNIKTQKLIGVEALIRWNHHSMGIIPPAKFITALEGSSLIIPVGEWVIKTAFESAVKWRREGYDPGIISINLSIVQLNDGDKLLKEIELLLKQTECMAEWIGIEVTESMMMKDPQKAIDVLHRLKEIGFKISVDDFGTGYSSLTYLKKMPIDKLKIDQSFVIDLPVDKEDAELTSTIIAMAKNLHLDIIAEGVETEEQKEFLIKHGCFEAQGYYYSKPVPESELLKYLKN